MLYIWSGNEYGDEEHVVESEYFALLKWWIINWNMSFLGNVQRTSHLLYGVCFNTVFCYGRQINYKCFKILGFCCVAFERNVAFEQ